MSAAEVKVERRAELHRKATYLPDTHRLLPQSLDAERGLLSSFLLAPREIGGLCAEKGVTPEHFHLPAHADIFAVLLKLWDQAKPIDFIILTEALRDTGQLDKVGGPALITEIFTFLPTAANAAYYLEIVMEQHGRRELIRVCTEAAARSYEQTDPFPSLLDEVEGNVLRVAEGRHQARTVELRKQIVGAITNIEDLYNRRGQVSGLTTGFSDFDKMSDGLHGTEMIVIAARPSMGKTAFVMNIAEHIAVDVQKPVAVFSLEMGTQQLVQRLLCSRARVSISRIRDGFLAERDFPALQAAASKLAESHMFIDDTSGLTIMELRARARRLKSQHGIVAIFVDYLQLLRAPSRRGEENRQVEVSDISAGLKGLAKELEVPVVVAAQLNRKAEDRAGGRPRLSDLRESGSIEQDADLVGLLVREEYYADSPEEKEAVEGKAELIIAKQRNGPVGEVPLTFLKEFTRFETRARAL